MKAVVILALLAGVAHADKPTIAIVGVHPENPESGKIAAALTRSLRGMKPGKYRPRGTPKQLDAAAIKAECKVVQPACAAAVGAELGVDFVLAGEITRGGRNQILVLALVDVKRKSRVRSLRESVAITIDPATWGKLMYQRLVDAELGELAIAANAQQGEILIDGQLVGALWEGRATLLGIAVGTHQLAIRAKGYKPFELDIRIDGVTRQNVLLEPAP